MEHIAAFLLVIGCSDDLVLCRELPAPQPVFETAQDCEAGLPDSFGAFMGRFPQLFAKCFEVDPLLAETDAEIVWQVTTNGHLLASVKLVNSEEVLVASRRENNSSAVAGWEGDKVQEDARYEH